MSWFFLLESNKQKTTISNAVLCPRLLFWNAQHEFPERLAALIGRILLQVMQALDGDLTLVGQGSAELTYAPGYACSGVAIDEQLGQSAARSEPPRVRVDDRYDICGLAFDRQLARPDESWQAPVAITIRSTICLHFLVTELADDAGRKRNLDKHVLVENQSFSLRRAQHPETLISAAGVVFPPARQNDGFHVSNRRDLARVAPSPVDANGRSP